MKRILWRDNFARITEDNGKRFVSVEWNDDENHMSNRKEASEIIVIHLGADWRIHRFVDVWYARRFDGHPARYRRYSILRTNNGK